MASIRPASLVENLFVENVPIERVRETVYSVLNINYHKPGDETREIYYAMRRIIFSSPVSSVGDLEVLSAKLVTGIWFLKMYAEAYFKVSRYIPTYVAEDNLPKFIEIFSNMMVEAGLKAAVEVREEFFPKEKLLPKEDATGAPLAGHHQFIVAAA